LSKGGKNNSNGKWQTANFKWFGIFDLSFEDRDVIERGTTLAGAES
jgi:hypothetical protein